ncbi:TonB-dependent receptor domain-containing protein [Stenotrophomonas oahuensis]|uniref:TonB-dependent receptor n=1 Tax=Stenotrophomonas oahuensis TaxID=3003271 RepID=A0ABY9YK24_9GAMM|nr:TonB-dependent receptor [Stenotrophomonas sp. A5586]WNH51234.1 TonB-dependent receptor [Stenotrophomonas sp. A5586]
MSRSRSTLSSAIALGLLASGMAATTAHAEAAPPSASTLDTIHVTGMAEDASKVASPISVISAERIQQGGGNLGEVLDGLPGVRVDSFGAGAGRPVIRGQAAPRVKVLSDSSAVLDASDISPDHAVTVDPLLGERIEVLRGPATLLYGGGAIGGVVNVLDNKIPERLPENGLEGRLLIRGNTVADERVGAASISGQVGQHLVLHAEGSYKDADNYRAPDLDESRVDATFSRSKNGSVGASWVTDNGYVGVAYSYREDDYGLPGHNHEYEGCHPHGSALHCGSHEHGAGEDHDHDHEHDHEHVAAINLTSKRYDLRGEYRDPFAGISRVRFRANYTDYSHDEIDGEEVTTTFANKGYDSRVELEHVPLGAFSGVFGIQHSDTEFSATGVEAFLPTVDTRSTGVFLVEHVEVNDQWHFELGARHEWLKHQPRSDVRNRPAFDDTASSFSGAAILSFTPDTSLTFSLSRSQRLPHAQELYARGIHMATNTYECGMLPSALTCGGTANDAGYDKETSKNAELTLRKSEGPLTYSLGVFANNVDNYIYARTLDQYEAFRLIKYTQADVEFRGVEAELGYQFTDAVSATLFGDRTRARFADGGGNVPRIPAARFGGRVNWALGAFDTELELYRVNRQRDIADYEVESPSYDMVNLTVAYTVPNTNAQVFLRGTNLANEQVWNHASFLASTVPQPGRNVSLGFSYRF